MEKAPSRRPKPSARNKMMDYLGMRDHSEKELREKLKKRFTPEEIDQAIAFGKESNWIPDSEEGASALSEKTAHALGRKGRGINYINQYLKKKGLPEIAADSASELEKAKSLVENKYSDFSDMDRNQKAKVGRFLLGRGFDMDVVRKVVFER